MKELPSRPPFTGTPGSSQIMAVVGRTKEELQQLYLHLVDFVMGLEEDQGNKNTDSGNWVNSTRQ